MKNNLDVYMHMIAMILILGFAMFYASLVLIYPNIYTLLKLISIIVIICCIYMLSNKSTFLPFLGSAVMPPILFTQDITPQGASETYVLNLDNVPDGTRVIYWGALSSNDVKKGPTDAYGDYSNTGITGVKDGKATVYFNCPGEYNVSDFAKTLKRHIHYRLVPLDNPMMSPVFTTYVKC